MELPHPHHGTGYRMVDPRLMDFDAAVAEFNAARASMDKLAGHVRLSHPVRIRASESAADVSTMCPIFGEAHEQAVEASLGQDLLAQGLMSTPFPSEEWLRLTEAHAHAGREELDRLRVAYKSMYFFVRAFQDAMYRLIWETATGQRSGRDSPMTKASGNPNNEVRKLIDASLPDYFDWFFKWRDERNEIKRGVGFAFAGPSEDLGVTFNRVITSGDLIVDCSGAATVRIGDVTMALTKSAELITFAVSDAERSAEG